MRTGWAASLSPRVQHLQDEPEILAAGGPLKVAKAGPGFKRLRERQGVSCRYGGESGTGG
ncbi:MAG: hypothetical protein MUE50_15405 [Pirellulaceae bacterium]|nr:hypothetical protein [Pirellulaceae bacterium]